MKEEMIINKEYKDSFNLGYQLAKELKIKTPIFENLDSSNSRLNAIQAGMSQFYNEFNLQNNLENIPDPHKGRKILREKQTKDKGLDMSI